MRLDFVGAKESPHSAPPMNTDHYISAVMALKEARKITAFTGAGISAESGIPTFRDADGFWTRFPPDQYANWKGLLQKSVTSPRSVAEFILHVIEPIAKAQPNAAHTALAKLQQKVSCEIITQNIDRLHQLAGSQTVHEVHGSIFEIVDTSTGELLKTFTHSELQDIAEQVKQYLLNEVSLPGLLLNLAHLYPWDWNISQRPNIVLFGDQLAEPDWSNAHHAAEECDVLLKIGTSGVVYPAAMLPDVAQTAGAVVISIDPQPSDGLWLKGKASEVLPKLVEDAMA